MMRAKRKLRENGNSLHDNFKQGDLVFGLNSFLKPVHDKMCRNKFKHYYCNSLNGPVVPDVIKDKPPAKTLDNAQKKHYQFLLRHKDYLKKEDGKPILRSPLEPDVSAAFRRACKLLLINREQNRNYTAHMILGDVDWQQVCDKTHQGVTNSELRAVYRDISLHGKHPNILFYNKKLELTEELPWEAENTKEIFAEYEQSRAKKRRDVTSTLPPDIETTETEITTNKQYKS